MYKGNIHAPKHAKLIYENATAPVFSLISNGGFSWNLNIGHCTLEIFDDVIGNLESQSEGRQAVPWRGRPCYFSPNQAVCLRLTL